MMPVRVEQDAVIKLSCEIRLSCENRRAEYRIPMRDIPDPEADL